MPNICCAEDDIMTPLYVSPATANVRFKVDDGMYAVRKSRDALRGSLEEANYEDVKSISRASLL